ncbi:MAG: hypothetical protein ACM3TU_01115 [Bacillota bacterium]
MKLTLPSNLTHYMKMFRYGERARPYRDWMVVISVAALLFLASGVWSYFLFREVSAGANLQASPETNALVNVASIETVRTMFDMRAAEQAHYRTDYHFVDPAK